MAQVFDVPVQDIFQIEQTDWE